MNWKKNMFFAMIVATTVVTQSTMAEMGNQIVEVTDKFGFMSRRWTVRITDPDGIAIVSVRIRRDADGHVEWTSPNYFPDCETSFSIDIPAETLLEYAGPYHLEVWVTDCQPAKPAMAVWKSPPFTDFVPYKPPDWSKLTDVTEWMLGDALCVSPKDWAGVDLAELVWVTPAPMNEGDPGIVTVNVYFGTDPNLIPGVNDSVQIETDFAGDSTSSFPGHPLAPDTYYYWRVDVIDPNNGGPTIFEGATWSFVTTVPAAVTVTESEGSTDVSEEDRFINRDDYILSLSRDPGSDVSVSITVSEAPSYNPLTDTKETVESFEGEPANAATLIVTHSGATDVSVTINNGDDDIEENVSSGGLTGGADSSELEIFDDGVDNIIGLRFNNVPIPPDAVINSAIVEFEIDGAENSGEVHGFVTGEAVDNAPAFDLGTAFRLRDRLAANPTASVPFIWTADYAENDKVPTSDIASIIQEIVDQPGWTSGGSIVIFLTEDMNPDGVDIDFIHATHPWGEEVSSTYVLDSGNWEAGVTVTIAGHDDEDVETDPELVTLTATTSSADAEWDDLPVADVIVSVSENDCGAWSFATYDLNADCYVDMGDLAKLVEEWLTCTMPNVSGCTEDYRP